jgi:hypothetical protein
MAMKALLQGDAGNYRIRGAIWELSSSSYRAYVHLVPATLRPDLPRSVVSVGGATLQEVLGAARARVKSTVGRPVENLEVRAASREPDPLGISALWRGGPLGPNPG